MHVVDLNGAGQVPAKALGAGAGEAGDGEATQVASEIQTVLVAEYDALK